jgi:hypothetical protein
MAQVDFDIWRRKDGSISLVNLWKGNAPHRLSKAQEEAGRVFLEAIEDVQRIRSRQVAVLAISTAGMVAAMTREEG